MFYLDTSAFLKLLVDEEHSLAMRSWYSGGPDCWSSQLLATEALRATPHQGLHAANVEELLDRISLLLPTPATFRRAGVLGPAALRSLDALHIASALDLVPEVEAIVAYDRRVMAGAVEAGLNVITPQ
jgi:predicted nucleic acid-binding protein